MSETTDPLLIEKAADGDVEAFSEIYYSLKNSIYGFALRMTRNRSIAEEITQDTFLFFIKQPKRYRPGRGSLFSFLCGVARNKIMNHQSRAESRLESNGLDAEKLDDFADSNGFSPLSTLLTEELSKELSRSVDQLSESQREVFVLREVAELTYEEIAEVTDTEVSVVKSRLYRARRSVAEKLGPYLQNAGSTVR